MKSFICAAVLGAVAVNGLAAGHQHQHARHHHQEKRDPVDYNDPSLYKDVDWSTIEWSAVFGKGKPAATAAPEAPAPAPYEPAPAASSEGSEGSHKSNKNKGSNVESSLGAGARSAFGGITAAIANGNVDEYIGNVGIPYGSNIIKISQGEVESFQYTNEFKNTGSSPANVIVWNKSGPDGRPNSGQYSTPALSFSLAPGSSQVVAFDQNSQVAFCNLIGNKKTAYGGNDCTFGEADFGNESNGGWSGYDVSSIQNSDGNSSPLSISSTNGATSSNFGNNYVSDAQAGGIGGNLAPGNVRLTTTIG